jgi:hypothetical protein
MLPTPDPNQVLVLFSGGADSTLAAIRMGLEFPKVELLTLTRRGLWKTEHVTDQAARLGRFFGDSHKFNLRFRSADRLCRLLSKERFWHNFRRHGLAVLSHCGLCKLSFHWRALVECLERGIGTLADGAVRAAESYPEQNEAALLGHLRALYARFGIRYRTPIYEEGEHTEQLLFELRYTRAPKVKGTLDDRQLVCPQQILYAMFLRTQLPRRPLPELARRLGAFYAPKTELVERWTREWQEKREASRLAALLES